MAGEVGSDNVKVILLNRFFYPDHSATSQLASDLAFHLAQAGWQVAVITSRLGYERADQGYAAQEQTAGVDIHRVRTSHFGRLSLAGRAIDYLTFYFTAGWRLLWLVKAGDVVVAKTDPPLISVVAALIVFRRGARLVNWVQDLFPEIAVVAGVRRLQGRFGGWIQGLRNRSLSRAEPTVVIGDAMAERLVAEGVPRSHVRVIHNWVDGEVIRPLDHAANPLRKGWDLDGCFVVGYSGNLGRVHEYATLLGAAERLRDQSGLVFLYIGAGALTREFRRECEARGLNNVRFKPYQPRERLGESLGVCDVHLVVLRPEFEGLVVPSKFYGVAAAGRPTLFVGDSRGEIARIIRDAEAGLTVPTGDAEGLADAVLRLRSDPDYRERMGRNARAVFDERYSRDKSFAQWEAVLRERVS